MKKNSYQPKANRFSSSYDRNQWYKLYDRAKSYFEKHPKPKYYRITGDSPNILLWTVDENDNPTSQTYLALTDEEVQRIKQLVLKLYNQTAEQPAATFEELTIDNYMSFRGKSKELDSLLYERAAKDQIDVEHIAWDNPLKFYLFSSYDYDMETKALGEAERGNVCLTDEQYLYLLTEQLYKTDFSFHYLLRYNAPFAQELLDVISGGLCAPSLITWDEIYADAELIRKDFPAAETLYREKGHESTITVKVCTNDRHEMSVLWEEYYGIGSPKFHVNKRLYYTHRKECDVIDGKAVRMLFGGDSDMEMCRHIKERFHGPNAFDNLLAFLEENNITIPQRITVICSEASEDDNVKTFCILTEPDADTLAPYLKAGNYAWLPVTEREGVPANTKIIFNICPDEAKRIADRFSQNCLIYGYKEGNETNIGYYHVYEDFPPDSLNACCEKFNHIINEQKANSEKYKDNFEHFLNESMNEKKTLKRRYENRALIYGGLFK